MKYSHKPSGWKKSRRKKKHGLLHTLLSPRQASTAFHTFGKPVSYPFIPLPEEAARIPMAAGSEFATCRQEFLAANCWDDETNACVVSQPIDCANEILLLSASYNPHVILLQGLL
jgi:hypothetical protein